jgi:release factor glutamine methyltransferase
MTNSKQLFHDLASRILIDEDKSEKEFIAFMIMAHIFDVSKTDLLMEKKLDIQPQQVALINNFIERLNQGEPIQQILEHAFFYGRNFKVNKHVLIPRPETEELVKIGLKFLIAQAKPKVLDIGTGSGCIPITIKLEVPATEVWATDINAHALALANDNAKSHQASINFIEHDILIAELPVRDLDLIISNPPYITESEKKTMQPQVLNYEPHLALFVTDDNPLKFYKAIARHAFQNLKQDGMLAVEINHRFGGETAAVFEETGLRKVAVVKDVSGKERFVTGVK